MPTPRLPRYVYNKTTIVGFYVALLAGATMLLSLFFQSYLGETNPYMGIVVYMVLPPFVIVGVSMVPIGMYRRWRHIKRGGAPDVTRWPYFDLNKKSHQRMAVIFAFATLLFSSVAVFGGYHAFHYTESVAFCGTTCHTVMKPEHVAYQNSSHARVRCTACHVGEGASFYAKSKLSGAYQVYAVLANVYPRPIDTPIKNLRPAQETCEQCHWPKKFFGAQQRQFTHYMYDEENTYWPINMLIKTGGGDPQSGQTAGIHWHMNIGVNVEYIARDERRRDIPWIRVHDTRTGRVTLYEDEDNPLTAEEADSLPRRKMDCMDCHNRPSHNFHSPDYMVDLALLTGQIDVTLPDIKRIAVEAMDGTYETEDEAMEKIAESMLDAYHDEYPDVFRERRTLIERAVLATQKQFRESIFPEMKVRWEDYPDNIGHFIFPGCMRCHDGKKVSADGWKITRDCTTCHAILRQGAGDNLQIASDEVGLEFVHPDGGDDWKEDGCYECHEGTQP